MKATIISPLINDYKPIAICTVIPFETVEVSISLSGGIINPNGINKWLNKNDVRIFEKNTDKDLTLEILGSENNHTFDGEDLTLILNKVSEYEKNKEYKLPPKTQKQIHGLQCLKDAILGKKGNRFAYLKELNSNGFMGWEIEDKELNEQMTDFVITFCSTKIEELKNK